MSRDVTIHGTGFKGNGFEAGPTSIHVGPTDGPTNVTNIVVVDEFKITCTLPPHDPAWPKRVGVWITTPSGSAHRDNIYHYAPPPALTITSISPDTGNYAGGVAVTIKGTGFLAVAGEHPAIDQAVFLGPSLGDTGYLTSIVIVDDNTITAVTPSGWPGRPYALQLSDGVRSATKSNAYYAIVPIPDPAAVPGLIPWRGTWTGGQSCILTRGSGHAFGTITQAFITQTSQVSPYSLAFTIVNDNTITFTMPNANTAGCSPQEVPHFGYGAVMISFYDASNVLIAQVPFQYDDLTVLTVGVAAGGDLPVVGGVAMKLTGLALDTVTAIYIDDDAGLVGPTTVDPATWHIIDEHEIHIDTIPAASSVCSTVFARYRVVGVSEAGLGAVEQASAPFSYVDEYRPVVMGCSPSYAAPAGGTSLTITGWNFMPPTGGVTQVKFIYDGGGPTCTFVVVDDNTITATSPVLTPNNPYAIRVTSGWGSGQSSGPLVTALGRPVILGITPSSGVATGGTHVVIEVATSVGCTGAKVGGVSLTGFAIDDATHVSGNTAAMSIGYVDVEVTNGYGTTTLNAFDYSGLIDPMFESLGAPVLYTLAPTSDVPTGGALINIGLTGSNAGVTGITFGGVAATGVTPIGLNGLQCRAPAHAAGSVSLVVTNGYGAGTAEPFTYL